MDFLRTRRELRVLSETTHSPFLFQSSTAITRTGPSDEQRPPFEPGTLLHEGRFAIKEVIGMGGEGVVYKAWDRALEQYVALKTLHVTDASHIPTLKREFRFLRGLSHPCLVQLHELVVDLQLSFFTMALVEGCHFLHATIDENALRSLLVQLSDVVAFLHSTGRVHRDIKATNILVRRDGSLVLLDFGIGLNLKRPESELKGPTGTPRYMAPELLLDRPASQESDAYSIGVLLYEALTGAHPSPTGRTEISLNMARRPSVLLPDVPADLDTLCYELLEPKPDQRATVQTIIATLGHFDERASRPFIQLVHERESFRGRSYKPTLP
jgi:serine/threonine protein kinase